MSNATDRRCATWRSFSTTGEGATAHVLLAMRYLGSSAKPEKTEEEARTEMQQISAIIGQAPARMPDHLKRQVLEAEKVKRKHKLA